MDIASNGGDAFLDASGHTLRRRQNCTLLWLFVSCCLLVAVLVLQIVGNAADSKIESKLRDASGKFAELSSMISGNPSTTTGTAAAAAAAAAEQYFRCPSGVVIPRKWIVLGSAYAHGAGADNAAFVWSQQLLQFAGPSRELLVPAGATLTQQYASLQNDSRFAQWLATSEPILVFYELGYVESLAAQAVQLGELASDPRALSPIALIQSDSMLLHAPWWHSEHNVVLFLVPSLPYSPPLGGFVPSPPYSCTDPLAAALFQHPSTFLTMKVVSETIDAVALTHALTSWAAQHGPSPPVAAHISVLSTEWLFARFGFGFSSSPDELAFASDCLYLNNAGQRLLARYLWACLQNVEFHVPNSLLDL